MTPHWRRKAIPRSDSPWSSQPPPRRATDLSRLGGVGTLSKRDRWLVGPTWLYLAAALIVFVVAAAVAIVQATSSDQPAAAAAQSTATATTNAQNSTAAGNTVNAAQVTTPSAQQTAQQAFVESSDAELASQPAQPTVVGDAPGNPLRGFVVPIAGACITEFEGHLPAATRAYRNNGIHEGLDFYEWAACVQVNGATPILAAKDGVVIRADGDYVDITPGDWDRFAAANWEGEAILDELRGRQIWIDHGRGVITRYAHLSAIAGGIAEGVQVERGQVIGYPGESGQQEVYAAPGTDIHLHFEIRVGERWLGQGLTPSEARQLYLEAFGLVEPNAQQ